MSAGKSILERASGVKRGSFPKSLFLIKSRLSFPQDTATLYDGAGVSGVFFSLRVFESIKVLPLDIVLVLIRRE